MADYTEISASLTGVSQYDLTSGSGGWGSISTSGIYSAHYTGMSGSASYQSTNPVHSYRTGYRVHIEPGKKVVSAVVLKVTLSHNGSTTVTFTANAHKDSPSGTTISSSSTTYAVSSGSTVTTSLVVDVSERYRVTGSQDIYIQLTSSPTSSSGNTIRGTVVAVEAKARASLPALSLSLSPTSVAAGSSVTASIGGRYDRSLNLTLAANGANLTPTPISVTADSKSFTTQFDWFRTASVTENSMSVTATVTDPIDGRTASRSFTLTRTALSLAMSPSSAIAGDTVTASTTGRYGRSLNLTFSANNVTLSTTTMSADTKSVATQVSWFTTASVTGNTMTATVTVTDPTDSRTASTTIQLTRPTALTVSATAPKSVTREGGESIAFSWSVSGTYGTQNLAELQYSTDNATWSSMGSVSGTGTTLTKSSKYFAPGTVYWRVRVRSTYGLYSTWSSASFTVRYSATSYVVPLNSPTGGNVNASAAITFKGTLQTDGVPYVPFTVASATFYWRSRSTDSYTQRSMTPSGATASVTIAGGTFPVGSISWYISATDNLGATTQTSVYTISTLASAIDAQPVAPVNTVEISNDDITFKWSYASTSGDPQNGAELQYSLDGSVWSQLATVTGTVTSYVAPPDTFHAGTVYWRVRAFNGAGTAGEWSTVAQFVAYGAPEAPSVTVDAVPFATVHWQGVGQASYEVEVDGTVYGPFLGTEKAYELYDYLTDGSHTARVRILGDAGLWSLWGETLFAISNVPTSTLTLRAKTSVDTELTWTGGSGDYHVYRDGKLIARTNEQSFTDRAVLGTHDYHVVERLASGNYNESALLTRTMEVEYMHIAALEGGDWIEILHTLKGSSDPSYQYNAETEFTHQDSSEFPVVSVGPYLDENASYSAVFLYTEPDEHRRFRALFRKPVILKTTDGVVMFGILNAWERQPKTSRDRQYYTTYTFSLRRIDWEDFIDDTT